MARKPITDLDKFREQFVRWTLRRASFRWPPRSEALAAGRVGRGSYKCAGCEGIFGNKEVKVDHIDPVIPVTGMQSLSPAVQGERSALDLGYLVLRMFPSASGFQLLCTACHGGKTATENAARADHRRLQKLLKLDKALGGGPTATPTRPRIRRTRPKG